MCSSNMEKRAVPFGRYVICYRALEDGAECCTEPVICGALCEELS
jgi:hypothetical protein